MNVAGGANDAASRPHGFADADADADASFKLLRKQNLHTRHRDRRAVQRSSSSTRSRQLQQEVEQMVNRMKHLSDEGARIEFAKELASVEEDFLNSAVDKDLVDEVSSVRADLCTQLSLAESDAANCRSFMDASCASRPLKVPSEFCAKFLRQTKHGQTDTAQADAVRFGANDAAAASGSEGIADQYAASPAAASGPGPAPGPAPMGPFFGGKAARPLPEQGFDGKRVGTYKDLDSHVADWQMEFGPNAGHRSFSAICADHQGNEWCRLHGYYDQPAKPKTIVQEIFDMVPVPGRKATPSDPNIPTKSGSAATRRLEVPTLAIALAVALLAQN